MKKITTLFLLGSMSFVAVASSTITPLHSITTTTAKAAKDEVNEQLLFAADGKPMKELIAAANNPKVNINYTNEQGETALIIAVNRNIVGPVEFLLSKKADVSKKDLAGNTPLFYAVANENSEMAKVLIRAGADVMALNGENQETALFEAARTNSIANVELLVAKNKKILSVKNAQGNSVLFVTAEFGTDKVAAKLVKLGADKKVKNSQGKTAAQVALENDNKETAKVLK